MAAFIVTFVVIEAIACFGRVVILATGHIPKRSPATIALDLIFALAFIGWGIFLLSSGVGHA